MNLRLPILGLALVLVGATAATAQTSATEEIIQLSKNKWQWMAAKDVAKLEPLFHERSKFVHMGGTWKKAEELDIIKTGRIWYKQADVHDVAAEIFENTGIVWSRITLTAMLGSNEVKTEFTVTEIFQKQGNEWKLLDLTFSSVRNTHQIQNRSARVVDGLLNHALAIPLRRALCLPARPCRPRRRCSPVRTRPMP
jgi:hypothetical protein